MLFMDPVRLLLVMTLVELLRLDAVGLELTELVDETRMRTSGKASLLSVPCASKRRVLRGGEADKGESWVGGEL